MMKYKNSKKKSKKIGQITIRKIGEVYAVCISGTPRELLNTYLRAEHVADTLRTKYGRRCKRVKKIKRKTRKK